MPTSPEELELQQRIEEMSPHQRAIRAVLAVWTALTFPISIALGITLAVLVSRHGPVVDGGVFLIAYFAIAMPGTIGGAFLQQWARRRLARRILRSLNEGANDAVGAGATPVGFLGSGDFREARDDVVPRPKAESVMRPPRSSPR